MRLGIQPVLCVTCIPLFPGRATLSLTLHLVDNHLASSRSIQLAYVTVLALQFHVSTWVCVSPSYQPGKQAEVTRETSNLEEREEMWAKFQEETEPRVLSPPLCFPLALQELVGGFKEIEAVAAASVHVVWSRMR